MRISSILTVLAAAAVLPLVPAGASAATAVDPAGDSCTASGACGFDLLTAGASKNAAGTLHFTATFNGTQCKPSVFPAVTTRPSFIVFKAGTTTPDPAAELAMVWATANTSEYVWTDSASDDFANLSAAVTASSVDVVVPASIASRFGGSFTWFVTNWCRNFPSDPIYSQSDIAPDTGLYAFTDSPSADVCPNLAGNQAAVPAGMALAAGRCVGTPAANRITGTSGADTIDAGAGNDRVSGGAGNDTLRGGAGNDRLVGGAGKDKLIGGRGRDVLIGGAGNDVIDARDTRSRAGRDTITCGSGRDTVRANRNDKVARDCERVVRVR